jgi:hypothetical protein
VQDRVDSFHACLDAYLLTCPFIILLLPSLNISAETWPGRMACRSGKLWATRHHPDPPQTPPSKLIALGGDLELLHGPL